MHEAARAGPLETRYSLADLSVLTAAERRRFVDAPSGSQKPDSIGTAVAWQLLYRLEPDLYDRLVQGERLHPGIWQWLPDPVGRAIEVGAGSGRLTVDLAGRCAELIAVEPAASLRRLLGVRLARAAISNVRVTEGFFDQLPVADGWAELVIACSALTPDPSQGGEVGLREMERACGAAGLVVIVWPTEPEWLARQGYRYESFPGEMFVEFASVDEAVALARVFYPAAVHAIEVRGSRSVPYDVLGINPPRDLSWKRMPARKP